MVSIGITPWGIVEKRNELVGKKTDIPFHSVAQPRSVSGSLQPFRATLDGGDLESRINGYIFR